MTTAHDGSSAPVAGVGAILLTGGTSSRMGHDKATLQLDGVPQAIRLARLLRAVASPLVEVGPGHSGLPFVEEEPQGEGPLVAIAAGATALAATGHRGPALVIACDLPLLNEAALRLLADYPGDATVLPLVGGHDQPLCARWSAADLAEARSAATAGERSLRRLPLREPAVLLEEAVWGEVTDGRAFADTDTLADLDALGLTARVQWGEGAAASEENPSR